MSREQSKYFILEPTDDTMLTWTVVGDVTAGTRAAAVRKHYENGTEPNLHVAVREAEWQPRFWQPKIVQQGTFQDVAMPVIGQTQIPVPDPVPADENQGSPIPV